MTETPIPNTFHHSDIFNDSAIHCFSKEMIARVPDVMWTDSDEPTYADDPEIVTQCSGVNPLVTNCDGVRS